MVAVVEAVLTIVDLNAYQATPTSSRPLLALPVAGLLSYVPYRVP